MHAALTTLIDRLEGGAISGTDVIPWGCPVPSFGDISSSRIATLGLNPSNREFVNELGDELDGPARRFPTLGSLQLSSWGDVDSRHLGIILESCRTYFHGNPYDRWFKRLDPIVRAAGVSYYDPRQQACHLDLIPYATAKKWTELTAQQRAALLIAAGDTLGLLLRDAPVEILILNGRAVVEHFQSIAGVTLTSEQMPGWSLPRQSTHDVPGIAYRGVTDTLAGISLGRNLHVLGYNHNIQSSFGVTTTTIHAIRRWIRQISGDVLA